MKAAKHLAEACDDFVNTEIAFHNGGYARGPRFTGGTQING